MVHPWTPPAVQGLCRGPGTVVLAAASHTACGCGALAAGLEEKPRAARRTGPTTEVGPGSQASPSGERARGSWTITGSALAGPDRPRWSVLGPRRAVRASLPSPRPSPAPPGTVVAPSRAAARRPIRLAAAAHRPDEAGELVGDCRDHDVERPARAQAVEPRPQLAAAPRADPDQGAGAGDQLPAQIAGAALARAPVPRLAGGPVLPGTRPRGAPGRPPEVAPGSQPRAARWPERTAAMAGTVAVTAVARTGPIPGAALRADTTSALGASRAASVRQLGSWRVSATSRRSRAALRSARSRRGAASTCRIARPRGGPRSSSRSPRAA
jgi:hypothetical protein